MRFILDASVALAWAFEDEGGDYALGVLGELRRSEAAAAFHWGLEVANGLLTAERRGRIDAAAALRFVRHLLALPIVIDPTSRTTPLTTTHRLARTHGLTSYDAAYLEAALRLGVPLATLDGSLAEAAEREGVGVFRPGES